MLWSLTLILPLFSISLSSLYCLYCVFSQHTRHILNLQPLLFGHCDSEALLRLPLRSHPHTNFHMTSKCMQTLLIELHCWHYLKEHTSPILDLLMLFHSFSWYIMYVFVHFAYHLFSSPKWKLHGVRDIAALVHHYIPVSRMVPILDEWLY